MPVYLHVSIIATEIPEYNIVLTKKAKVEPKIFR